jgi:CPA1 family monovalent cation:H+ antiporter
MSTFDFIGIIAAVVAVFGYLNHRYVGLPDTIGITAMGLIASLVLAVVGHQNPGAVTWASDFADRLDFTEIVFHGMLGVLLFAGSLHVNISDLARQRIPVFVLSTIGVVLSTVIVGYGAHWILETMGIHIQLIHCLLFGALISPTDPIAVLGILKTAGAPKDMEMNITGESLFNDGTGVVVFLVLLGIASSGAEPSFSNIGMLLIKEIVGAVALGLAVGYLAFFMLKGIDSYPVEIIITIALATGGYSLAERLRASAPLAVVVMGLVIGNHGAKSAMSNKTREHLFSFWDLIDEVLNLALFGLIGIKLLALDPDNIQWVACLALVPVVLFARMASVGIPVLAMKPWFTQAPHTIKVLTWGGLRGGISVALALSLPAFQGKELFVTATYGVVLFSLLIQAPTLGPLLKRLRVCEK